MTETPATGDDISAEARMIAEKVQERAAAGPSPEELARIAAAALGAPSPADITPEQVRHLAVTAVTQAQQVSYLMGKLAGLLAPEGDR